MVKTSLFFLLFFLTVGRSVFTHRPAAGEARAMAQDGGFTAVVVPLPPLLCCCSCQNWLCNFNTNAYWCCPYFGRLKTYVSEIRDEAMVCVWKCEV
jgi:hypothetical protein